ncbi:heterokaryon incompatibility protein-domain-containing protein [Nemania sp. FL0031]|nr:heterokaryon incompatibility protein-domain-containing protein [Nemania sp. FL0031]
MKRRLSTTSTTKKRERLRREGSPWARTEAQLSSPTTSQDIYETLPDGFIRSIELLPGQFDNDIIVKLHLQPFESHKAPIYEALSYAWGPKIPPNWVRVIGAKDGELQVTKNLDSALRHLRYTDRSRFLWVDAICINQLNDVEKGPQVSRMSEIFRSAARVVVWLGPAENNSDRAMALMEYMGSQVDEDATGGMKPSREAHDKAIGNDKITLPWEVDDIFCLFHFLCRSWFERLWVRQEIFLAKEGAMVLCGSFSVSWKLFRRGCMCLYRKSWKEFEHADQLFIRIKLLNSLIFPRRTMGPSAIRSCFGNLDCQDPRDRVYAVLEFLRPSLRIQPDYTKSVVQVYEDLVTRYISSGNGLNILAECRLSHTSRAPSWLPEWSWEDSAGVDNGIMRNTKPFASGHIRGHLTTPISGELEVWGVIVGRIRRLGERSAGEYSTSSVIAAIRNAFDFLPSLFSSDYITGGTLLEACTSTLCLGKFSDSYSVPRRDLTESSSSARILGKLIDQSYTTLEGELLEEEWEEDEWEEIDSLLSSAHRSLQSRCVYETEEGFIGVAPQQAHIDDQICVLLDCDVPMVLRYVDKGKYVVVGACYTCGVGLGEALLGPLPKHIRLMEVWDDVNKIKGYVSTFVDDETGERSRADPRLKDWPIDYEKYAELAERGDAWLNISPEVFQEKGVDVQSFTLI